jgi:hypothetical protein
MIKQLAVLFILSILVTLVLNSHELALLINSSEKPIFTTIGFLLGYALSLLLLSMLIAIIPRSIYWLMKKKNKPEYHILVWSIWIIIVVIISVSHVHQNIKTEKPKIIINTTNESNAKDIYSKVVNSIYTIYGKDFNNKKISLGSAVAVTTDYLATNCHVVEEADHFTIVINKQEETGHIYSKHDDLCIITSKNLKLNPAEIRRSKSVEVGESVYAIGNPKQLTKSISDGIISNKHDINGLVLLQTNAAISAGSSGGGLFDREGKLIGITTIMSTADNTQNLNFVLPTELIEAAILEPIPIKNKIEARNNSDSSKTGPSNNHNTTLLEYEVLGVYGRDAVILVAAYDTCFITIIGKYNPETISSLAIWSPKSPNSLILFSKVTKIKNIIKFINWTANYDNIKIFPSKSFIFHDKKLDSLGIYLVNNTIQPVYIFSQEKPITEELLLLDHVIGQFYDETNGMMTSITFGLNGFTEALQGYNQFCKNKND